MFNFTKQLTDMKNHFLLIAIFFVSSFVLTNCNTNDPDLVDPLLGTYVGALNVGDPAFQSTAYTVVVTRVNSDVVKFTPSGSAGSQWTAHITNIAGVYTCISCVLNNQVTFTSTNGIYNLSYNYDDNNEQFTGVKQ